MNRHTTEHRHLLRRTVGAVGAVILAGAAFVVPANAEPPSATVSGTVTDAAGTPLKPAALQVSVYNENGDGAVAGQVNPDGTYTVNIDDPGTVFIAVQDFNHVYYYEFYGSADTLAGATPVTVAAGEHVSGIDIELDNATVATATFTGPGGQPLDSNAWIGVAAYNENGALAASNHGPIGAGSPTVAVTDVPTGRYRLAFYDIGCGYNGQYFDNATLFTGAQLVTLTRGHVVNLGVIELSRSNGTCVPTEILAPTVTRDGATTIASWNAYDGYGEPAVTGYTVASLPPGAGCTTTGATTCTVTGMVDGQTYRLIVFADNAGGRSRPGAPSAAFTAPQTGTPPAGLAPDRNVVARTQAPRATPKRIRAGKPRVLARRTSVGTRLTWTTLTPRTCTVHGHTLLARKAGVCRLRQSANATGEWLRLAHVTATRVIR